MNYQADLDAMTPVARQLYSLARNVRKATGMPLPVVGRASPEWDAWRQWRKEHGEPVGQMDRQERWTVPLTYPPADLERADQEWQRKAGGGAKAQRIREAIS